MVRDCVSISLLKAATAVSGLHGWLQIADITAKKSAPARIKTPQFSPDMPPMATHGTVVELRHQVRSSGSARTRGCLVDVGKKAPKAI